MWCSSGHVTSNENQGCFVFFPRTTFKGCVVWIHIHWPSVVSSSSLLLLPQCCLWCHIITCQSIRGFNHCSIHAHFLYMHFHFFFFFFIASIVGILLPAKGLNLNRLFGLLWSSWLRFWHFIPFKSPFSGGFKCILTTPLHWCLKGWGQDAAPRRDTVVF